MSLEEPECNVIHLDLSCHHISNLGNITFASFVNLKFLNLSQSNLIELPVSICSLSNLTELDVSFNDIHEVPDEYSKLKRLRKLNLSHNRLEYVPSCLYTGLRMLSFLDMSSNYIRSFEARPLCAPCLSVLNLSNNHTMPVPTWIWNYCHLKLKVLNISNVLWPKKAIRTQYLVQHGYTNTGLYTSLLSLDIANNNLIETSITFVKDLKQLKVLKLGEGNFNKKNTFASIAPSILDISCNIVELYLVNCGLVSLTKEMDKFVNLEILDASCNHLLSLPENFCTLKKLKICNLSENSLILLPAEIGQLKCLEELYLDNNRLETMLPDTMKELTSLKYLDMYKNMLRVIPKGLSNLRLHGVDFSQNYVPLEMVDIDNYNYLEQQLRTKRRKSERVHGHQLEDTNNELEDDAVPKIIDEDDDDSSFSTVSSRLSNVVTSIDHCASDEIWTSDDDLLTGSLDEHKLKLIYVTTYKLNNDSKDSEEDYIHVEQDGNKLCPFLMHHRGVRSRRKVFPIYEGQFDEA